MIQTALGRYVAISPGVRRIPAPMVPPIPIARPKARPRTRSSLPGLLMSTPQLLEGPLHVHAGHLLAPRKIEIGVVHRLRGAVGGIRGFRDRFIFERRPDQRRSGLRDVLRITRDSAEHHPSVG